MSARARCEELAALLDGPDEAVAALAGDALAKLRWTTAAGSPTRSRARSASRAARDRAARGARAARSAAGAPAPEPPVPDRARARLAGAAAMLAAFLIPILASAYEGWNTLPSSPCSRREPPPSSPGGSRGPAERTRSDLVRGRRVHRARGVAVPSLRPGQVLARADQHVRDRAGSSSSSARLAILAAGVICLRSSPGVAAAGPLDPGTLMIGMVGAGLTIGRCSSTTTASARCGARSGSGRAPSSSSSRWRRSRSWSSAWPRSAPGCDSRRGAARRRRGGDAPLPRRDRRGLAGDRRGGKR